MSDQARPITDRELNVRIFQGAEVPRVLWQPRMEPWYAWHEQFGSLPECFKGMSLLEVYDELGQSMRYIHYYTGMPDPVRRSYTEKVRVRHSPLPDGDVLTITETPHGELVQQTRQTVDRTWRTIGFPVKKPEDLKALAWLLERTRYTFDAEKLRRGSEFIGERGEPQFWVPKSPYQALCQSWMKLHDFIYALADAPGEVEQVMEAIDRTYDALYEDIIASGQAKIINFGENIHDSLLSPAYFERYLVPWYEKRSGQLRSAGIYTHVHIDGYFKSLLPHLAGLPFDGLEALTPLPQGDVSLEEMKDHIGDKVLLDGIPAVYFLPHYPLEELARCVERLVELFHPRLVLGISDELPEGVDESGIEKVRWVSDYCRRAA
ncbi:MAG: hypothetical protein AMK73_00440 [Planctomycetes bacterium SM23_32]|nr:MAG: hypothetical protein AMK73_00440 [Planctomycetes bacterium SM23_32]